MQLRDEVLQFLGRVMDREGTNLEGAVRDVLTELKHICDANHLDFEDRFQAAVAVASEEDGFARCGVCKAIIYPHETERDTLTEVEGNTYHRSCVQFRPGTGIEKG